jgi:hypothetical protein
VKRRSLRIWPLVGAVIGALAVTSVSGAGHDGTNVFHLGVTDLATAPTTLQTNITGNTLALVNTNTGSPGGALFATNAGAAPTISATTTSSSLGARAIEGLVVPMVAGGGTAAVRGFNNGSGTGVSGGSANGAGVTGTSNATAGVSGAGPTGVFGGSSTGTGVSGSHQGPTGTDPGVRGATASTTAGASAILGILTGFPAAADAAAVRGVVPSAMGTTTQAYGVWGSHAVGGIGVRGTSSAGTGAYGLHESLTGTSPGLHGRTDSATDLAAGVYGEAPGKGALVAGVYGNAGNGIGLLGSGGNVGVLGYNPAGVAGLFAGNVAVTGTLTKGAGAFRIDHPLDPQHKYLQHSFVESPDMKNVYDGVVTTDRRGFATVKLPRYFQALNRDFRYQLTSLSGLQNVAVAQKIRGNRFVVQGEKPRSEISWQVTGIRKDRYANAHRIQVEVAKTAGDRAATALKLNRAAK